MPNIFAASDRLVFAQRDEHRAHKAPRSGNIGRTPASCGEVTAITPSGSRLASCADRCRQSRSD
jgi:hypothetical protein